MYGLSLHSNEFKAAMKLSIKTQFRLKGFDFVYCIIPQYLFHPSFLFQIQ